MVAIGLRRDTRGLLIGEAALPEEREKIVEVLTEHPEVDEVVELLTMAMGPDSLLVAVRLDLAPAWTPTKSSGSPLSSTREMREAVPAPSTSSSTPRAGASGRSAPPPEQLEHRLAGPVERALRHVVRSSQVRCQHG